MSDAAQLARRIEEGLNTLGLQPDARLVAGYVRYIELLRQWNKAYNLTAIRDPEKIVTHHILDSLSVLPYLHGDHCLDVGTGAGLPGLILALATPGKQWTLLDSNRKKIRFVNQAVMELKPANVTTECIRVEQYRPHRQFTTIITRAFGSLSLFHQQTRHLLAPNGKLLAMKGGNLGRELKELDAGMLTAEIHPLHVPGIQSPRILAEIKALPDLK